MAGHEEPTAEQSTNELRQPEQSNEQRLSQIMRTHRPALLAYSTRLVDGDTCTAEDVVQETFVRAWRRIDRLTPEFGSVNAWLRRVAFNVAVDGHRMRQARPVEVELEHPNLTARGDHTEDVLRSLVVENLLGSIWPEHREILIEVYLNDRTVAQAAAVLSIPVGTAKSRLFYALRSLRGSVDDEVLCAS